jgi:ribosomal protein S18 acetylase RimI-like enzyme
MQIFEVANTARHYEDAKILFLEYANSLNFDLCFQNFDKEIADLKGEYTNNGGCILLCYENNIAAGCVGLRRLENNICEMKRLYLRNEFRGTGIGRKLAEKIIDKATEFGYEKMRLDTIDTMKEAISLYKKLGFIEIKPYRENPVAGAIYMELVLNSE